MVLSFVIRWYNKNRTTKCLKSLQKRSIDDNLRQLVLIRQDRVLVNLSTCFFTSDYSEFFCFAFPKKWVGRAMGNETFYGDGLIHNLAFRRVLSSPFKGTVGTKYNSLQLIANSIAAETGVSNTISN